jgi:N-acetylmuramoyl-L-alanine amidase
MINKSLVFCFAATLLTLFSFGQGINTIVLDAGHGGTDPGNLGTGRYKEREKDIALDVTLKVGAYIEENFPEVKVIYTRKTDVFLPLHERTEIANNAQADLFVSIHCNAVNNTSVYGTETYVMGFKYSKNNLELTKKENAVIFMEDDYEQNYDGLDLNNPESNIIAALYQNAFLDQSINFANFVERQFKERVGRKSRGVKQSVLFVMNRTTMPSALIEMGFLSNKQEEDFLNTENGRSYIASAIYRAFKDYKQTVEGLQDMVDHSEEPKPAIKELVEDEEPKALQKKYELVYKVQVMSSVNQLTREERKFDGGELEELQLDGRYKYFYKTQLEYKDAKQDVATAKKMGFKSAFVVALKNGKPIALSEALNK